MKFQDWTRNFQDQLENRVLCKTFHLVWTPTKRDQLNLKMHSNDKINNILHQFHANCVNTIISMQTKHETLLVISIIDSFCAQLKLFCETVISSEYFQVVWENTNFNLKIFGRVLRIQHYFMKIVMFWKIWEFIQMCNVLNCTIFSINRMSFAENHSLMRSTKFEPILFFI